jgi:hypothetical protein
VKAKEWIRKNLLALSLGITIFQVYTLNQIVAQCFPIKTEKDPMTNLLWSILISTQKSIQKKWVKETPNSFLTKVQVLLKPSIQT